MLSIFTALLLSGLSGPNGAQASHVQSKSLSSVAPGHYAPARRTPVVASDELAASFSNLRSVAETAEAPRPSSYNGGSVALGTCACSGAPSEGEANCGLPTDTFNGGCNSSPNVYSAITLGQSVCGTGAYNGSSRDTDWYRFTLTTTTTVVFTVRAEFDVQVALLADGCPVGTVYANVAGPACTDVVAAATLPAGTFDAFVAAQFSNIVTCGTSDDYHASLIGVSSCGYDSGVSDGSIGLGNFNGGEQLYLHMMGGEGQFARVNSVSMCWGTPSGPGSSVPPGTAATIRIFKDPNDDGIPSDLVQIGSKGFLTSGASTDTDVFQTVALDAPVDVSGVYFVGVSVVSGANQFPLGFDFTVPSNNRGWFVGETAGSGGAINYGNLPGNDFFGENSALGINGVYMLRADCEPQPGGCKIDDDIPDTTAGYAFAGEKMFLHRYGSPGDVDVITSVSMSWGSSIYPGNSIPNGSSAQIRIFDDPNDDGILDDGVQIYSQGFLTAGVDTGTFQTVALTAPVTVRGVYFVGVSVVAATFQYPMGFDESTTSDGRAWFVAQNGGAINYANLPSNSNYGVIPASYGGLDGVHMLRADCHPQDEITAFCAPGVGGIVTCPCGNPQVPAGATKGCNNFAGGGTGGAILAGSGAATISGDTIAMNVTAGVASNVTVLFQGTTNTVNSRTGAGVKCVGGTLKRVYKGNQAAGSIAFPNNAVPFHTQSAAKGYTIVAPITLYYYAAYRNSAANGQPGCPGLTFGFNSTNALAVIWTP
jgi:hypothetical protein